MSLTRGVIGGKFLEAIVKPNTTIIIFFPVYFPFNAIRSLEKHWIRQITTIFSRELVRKFL
ncbi:hypothetical protein Fmac_023303 [Flemingia macrophylla]|uniref:Uncharacterized protein n=1 Tax=Flemingia macrophylla TaxID=520843 RepID=A0ABD1LMR8_9FABA